MLFALHVLGKVCHFTGFISLPQSVHFSFKVVPSMQSMLEAFGMFVPADSLVMGMAEASVEAESLVVGSVEAGFDSLLVGALVGGVWNGIEAATFLEGMAALETGKSPEALKPAVKWFWLQGSLPQDIDQTYNEHHVLLTSPTIMYYLETLPW